MVVFERPLDVDFVGAFVANSPLAWVAHDAAKPERGEGECWVLHTTPDWSAAHLDDAPDAVAAALLAAFGEALATELPATRHLVAHRWLFARCEEGLGEPYLWDAETGLGVCGDWTAGGRLVVVATRARGTLCVGDAAALRDRALEDGGRHRFIDCLMMPILKS